MNIIIAIFVTISILLPFIVTFAMLQIGESTEESALAGIMTAVLLSLFWIAGFGIVQVWQWAL